MNKIFKIVQKIKNHFEIILYIRLPSEIFISNYKIFEGLIKKNQK